MPHIARLHPGDLSLEVTWSDGVASRYPWIWLRDHAEGVERVLSAGVPRGLRGVSAEVADDHLLVTWDILEPVSSVAVSLLRAHRLPRVTRTSPDIPTTMWSGSAWAMPTVAYDQAVNGGAAQWLRQLMQFGVVRVTGAPTTAGAGEELLRSMGAEPTGAVHRHDDSVGERGHTDGSSRSFAPALHARQVLEQSVEGGEYTLVDGFAIARRMESEHPDEFETLSTAMIPGQRPGGALAARPVFRHDHTGRLVQVTYNEMERAPFLLAEHDMAAVYDALWVFDELANETALQWRGAPAPGEILVVDNWRVLHGRLAGGSGLQVWVGYVDRDAVDACLRAAR